MKPKKYLSNNYNVHAVRGEQLATTGFLPNSKDVKGLLAERIPEFSSQMVIQLQSKAMDAVDYRETLAVENLTLTETELIELAKNFLSIEVLLAIANEKKFEQELDAMN